MRRVFRPRFAWVLALLILAARPATGHGAVGSQDPHALFDWAWTVIADGFFDPALHERLFTQSARESLMAALPAEGSAEDVKRVFMPFLESLGVSHMGYFTRDDLEYHLFRSMDARSDTLAKVWHAGLQGVDTVEGFRVHAVWDGLPGARAGLRRGDRILSADGAPFHLFGAFDDGRTASLVVDRGGRRIEVDVTPIEESIHRSMIHAMRSSVRIFRESGRTLGYVHVWGLTPPNGPEALAGIVSDSLTSVDGIVLDLRDGFGGWWFDDLAPFGIPQQAVLPYQARPRDGEWRSTTPAIKPVDGAFRGPMVAIINEGSRSGKEGLAYQLRTAGRVRLVGARTKGYFHGSDHRFSADRSSVVFIAVSDVRVGDAVIEGVGVTPDVVVPFPADGSVEGDPQLEAAVRELVGMIKADSVSSGD